MNDILLAKPSLPPGFIDLAVGEPYVIRNKLFEIFGEFKTHKLRADDFEYQNANGYQTLVKQLEDKHGAPVIITNGAKQSVAAVFHACKRLGKLRMGLKTPYWGLFKPLIEMMGLSQVEHIDDSDAYLLVHPNNPDGFMYDEHTLNYYTENCKRTGKPLIHDGAYYSHVYLPQSFELKPIGDVQIFTFSKLFGLSGLRIGYTVFHNTELYKYVLEYMEHMTVGVSITSQMYASSVLTSMGALRDKALSFEEESYALLQINKGIASQINPSILDTSNIEQTVGMFLWAKCHNFDAFKKAKLNVIEGTPFGMPGYVRMNLALDSYNMQEVVERLNNV